MKRLERSDRSSPFERRPLDRHKEIDLDRVHVKFAQGKGHLDPVFHALAHAENAAAAYRKSQGAGITQNVEPLVEGMGRADAGEISS